MSQPTNLAMAMNSARRAPIFSVTHSLATTAKTMEDSDQRAAARAFQSVGTTFVTLRVDGCENNDGDESSGDADWKNGHYCFTRTIDCFVGLIFFGNQHP